MRMAKVILACFSPRELLDGVRMCMREGCGLNEAISITSRSVAWGLGKEPIEDELNARLERSMWIAEHPGCTKADVDAWEYEQFLAMIAECKALLAKIDGE